MEKDKKVTALYCRLSKDDGSNSESLSIRTQKSMLMEYATRNGFGNCQYYVDDGYSGTNSDRPAFQELLDDIREGKVATVITKDQSRLGRNHIETGTYMEIFFPEHGVRYIAINDGYDSNEQSQMDIAPFRNIINEMYAKDTSRKIKSALRTRKKSGKYISSGAPFGYQKDPADHNHLVIDPNTAPVVEYIYSMAEEGLGLHRIAKRLHDEKVLKPCYYKKEMFGRFIDDEKMYDWDSAYISQVLHSPVYAGHIIYEAKPTVSMKSKKRRYIPFEERAIVPNAKRKNLLMGSNPIIAPDSEMLWNAAIVWRILRRYEYTGALVMGRRKKIDVNTTSVRTLPEDKWIIAENAHEAIVTKDEYYQAQKAIRNVTPIQYKVGDDFALKGKICCGNCNRQLRHERQYGEMVFYCGYKRSAGKFSKCYGGYYREYSVNAKVARAIKTVFYALDVVNQGMQEKQSITVRCMDIEDLEKQAEAIRVEQIKLYESYADGVLLRDAYIEKKKALSEKLAALRDSIRTEKEEQECADELDEEIRALTKQANEKTYIGGLTKECVDAFVSMVYLYDDQTMKIEFNCEDVIRRALEKYGA